MSFISSSIIGAALASLIAWGGVLALIVGLKMSQWSRIGFVIGHYAADLIVFAVVFFLYYRIIPSASPFSTMAASMITLFILEAILWQFFLHDRQYLTFVDWVIPAFLIATTVYGIGFFQK